MKNVLNKFFPEKNKNYDLAKLNLIEIKKKFDNVVISFPNISKNEMVLIKEKWESVPDEISKGVKIMGVKSTNEYKSIITSYEPKSYIIPYVQSNLYEFGTILKGSIVNNLTGDRYVVGDEYKINPNEPHFLMSENSETMVYSVLTKNSNFKIKPLSHKIKNFLNLT